ncbi:MAG: SpoIIE family protein phosphatase [Ruminococcus sp.]|nr:SpoIIE family protein phosphatase [Ruminococcus sp.]
MNKLKTKPTPKVKISSYTEKATAIPKTPAGGYALRCFFTALISFTATFGKMVGFPSFMNVAVAALAGRYSAAALLGTAISCAATGSFDSQAVQLGAMLIFTALNIFFPDFSKGSNPIRLSLYTAGITLLLSTLTNVVSTSSFTVSMRMISSLLCACTVYAAAFIYQAVQSSNPLKISGLNAVYLCMIYMMATVTLCSCQIGIFNLGRIFACIAIPIAAKKRRSAGAAVMGALSTISITMCSSSLAVNTMLLAAAGLICSAFADLGRVAMALAFMISASAALATTGLNGDTFNMLSDIIAASVIFTALPSSFFNRALSCFIIVGGAADSASQTASSRLSFAAMTISDIRQKLIAVTDTVEARAESITLSERIMEQLCDGCRLYDECRKNGCAKGVQANCLKKDCRAVGCIRADELDEAVKCCIQRELDERAEAMRMREMRELFHEQLGSMSDLLNDISCRLSRRREIDVKLSSSAKAYFEREGFTGVRACVYIDENFSRHAEIYLSGGFEGEALSLTAGLCRTLECDFELPGITCADRLTKLEFDEKPPFSADFGSYAALGSQASCSGDALENVGCSAGERYILLSDGMGSGKRARLDSAMSLSLAAHMLHSGISMATVQRIINSVMRVKDWEESFATLDFLKLDLFSGRAEFLKSGAAPAYLCRDGSMIKIDCDSYPAGIFTSSSPDLFSCKLFDGDILMLASDGAPFEALECAAQIAYDSPDIGADSLAYAIGSRCVSLVSEKTQKTDDITLAIVKISYKKDKNSV